MKLLVAMCLMAASVSAQWGESGVVHADGTLQQFTRAEADNVAGVGPSGVIMHNGPNVQFGLDMAALHNKYSRHRRSSLAAQNMQHSAKKREAIVGSSAVITPGGKMIQLPHGVTVTLSGPSAVQLSDGSSIQYEH